MRILAAVAAGCIVAGLATAHVAFGEEPDGQVQRVSAYCRDRRDFGLSHGGCVAQFTTGNTTPHNASVCKLAWVRAWLGVDNEGACVTSLNELTR